MTPDDIDFELAARRWLQVTAAFILVCVLGIGLSTLAGCSLFQSQADIASLCTRITDRNAGVICVKAGYTAVADAGELAIRRHEQGAISRASLRTIGGRLEEINDAVEIAEVAVFAGRWGEAEDRMNAVIELLNALEGSLK